MTAESWLRREWGVVRAALAFFTRLPVGAQPAAADLALAVRYLPLVGWVVGALSAGVYALASWGLPSSLAVVLALTTGLLVTGAFHEDGWADTLDGLGGGWTRERALTIMKDSHIGSFGVIGLVMLLLGKYAALDALAPVGVAAALIAGHTLSRLAPVVLMRRMTYARSEASKAAAVITLPDDQALWTATACALLPLFWLPAGPAMTGVLLALLAAGGMAWWQWRRLGGYTGDTLGATQQAAELAFYLGLACISI